MKLFLHGIRSISPLRLCSIPVILMILSLVSLGMTYIETGLPVQAGMEFQGGLGVTLVTHFPSDQLQSMFSGYPLISVEGGINNGKYLKFGPMDDIQSRELMSHIERSFTDAKIDYIGSSFGKTLQDQAGYAILLSFIGMAIVVFGIFRSYVPSLAVVIAAVGDIVMTAAAMNVLGIPLTLGTTAALLMLIGYSVDSDILLTSRVLKRQGQFDEKVAGAFRTGIIMTSTTFSAIFAMWIISLIGGIQIISEISMVLLIGLIFDVLNTWMTNVGILKWYVTRTTGRGHPYSRGS